MRDFCKATISTLPDIETGRLQWNVGLPSYVPTEQIALDVLRFNQLARLGGFSEVHVGSYDGRADSYDYVVDGTEASGEATASTRLTVHKAERSKTSILRASSIGIIADGMCTIRLNSTQMIDEVEASKQRSPLRSPKAWSRVLNRAVSSGLRQASHRNLLAEVTALSVGGLLVYPTMAAAAVANDPESWAGSITEYGIVGCLVGTVANGMCKVIAMSRGKDCPFSMVPFIPLDRLAAVEAGTKLHPLIISVSF